MRRPGRPPGISDTTQRILANARELFAHNGINRTSIRAIAAAAGVAAEVALRVGNPPGSGRIRVQLVASQLIGVLMARYVIKPEPFAPFTARADREDHRAQPAAPPDRGAALRFSPGSGSGVGARAGSVPVA